MNHFVEWLVTSISLLGHIDFIYLVYFEEQEMYNIEILYYRYMCTYLNIYLYL